MIIGYPQYIFHSFIHLFIHCRHLYSAFSSGTTQKRSQPQRGQIMLFKVAEGISGRIVVTCLPQYQLPNADCELNNSFATKSGKLVIIASKIIVFSHY